MTDVLHWPCACTPIVARGRDRRGAELLVYLHALNCPEPVERRRALVVRAA
jgi:hypothetical protein